MDSAIDCVHWEKSSLPVFADAWINDKVTEDLSLLEEFEFKLSMQLEKEKSQTKEKMEWKPNPMEI